MKMCLCMKLNLLAVNPQKTTGLLENNNNSWKQCKGLTGSGFGMWLATDCPRCLKVEQQPTFICRQQKENSANLWASARQVRLQQT